MSDIPKGAGDRLVGFIQEIERVEEDRAALAADIKAVYESAKGEGFDVKVMRKVIMQRRKTPDEVDQEKTLLEVYMDAVGWPDGDPLAGDMRGDDGVPDWTSQHAKGSA